MAEKALELLRMSKTFGGVRACQDVSFSVEQGARHLILGPNGAGKTTLFNVVSGNLRATSGQIRSFGAGIGNLSTHARARLGMARTYQILTLFETSTVLHNVMLSLSGIRPDRISPWADFLADADLRSAGLAVLSDLGLDHLRMSRVDKCSYGDKRRLEIALALAQRPRLLLLDEPLAGLSEEERGLVASLLRSIPRATTIVFIEHDMDVALDLADNLTLLNFGQHVISGLKDDVIKDQRTRDVYLA